MTASRLAGTLLGLVAWVGLSALVTPIVLISVARKALRGSGLEERPMGPPDCAPGVCVPHLETWS